MKFNTVKRGYNPKEVDDFLRQEELKRARESQTLIMRIDELKAKILILEQEAKEFKGREKNVNEALIAAIERAKEMDSTAKIRFALEGERIKLFAEKWQNFVKKKTVAAKLKNEVQDYLLKVQAEIADAMDSSLKIMKSAGTAEAKPQNAAERQYFSEKARLAKRNTAATDITLDEILHDII